MTSLEANKPCEIITIYSETETVEKIRKNNK